MLRTVAKVLPVALALAACADSPLPTTRLQTPAADAPDTGPLTIGPPPGAEVPCASPRVEVWAGTATRTAEYYPDDIETEVTWRRVGSTGCVDRYAPAGGASYRFAIPGALCRQDVAPAQNAVAGAHGSLEVDRSTSPATYRGTGATSWSVTWTCTMSDGSTETMTFDGGGQWFEATGTLDGATITGERVTEDGSTCGLGQSSLPCTYAWSFEPVE